MIIRIFDAIIILMDNKNNVRRLVIRYTVYTTIVLGLTFLAFYLSIGKNAHEVFEVIKSANLWYIAIIFALLILCILFRSIAIYALAKNHVDHYSFHRALAIDQIGVLYRMVTPAGLGGNIMQTQTYRRQGMHFATALSLIAMYSIIYQIVLIIYNFITIIVKHDLITQIGHISISFIDQNSYNVSLWLLVAIGFGINVLVIFFIFGISYWNGIVKFLDGPIRKLLIKMHVLKTEEKEERYREKLISIRDHYRASLGDIFAHTKTFIICFIMFFGYITLSYSIPYFVGKSLGNTSAYANFWDSVLLSNFHQMITSIVPTPGNTLFSELFFLRLFYPNNGPTFYINEEVARASLLLWRSLAFIIPLAIACIWTVVYSPRRKKKYADYPQY